MDHYSNQSFENDWIISWHGRHHVCKYLARVDDASKNLWKFIGFLMSTRIIMLEKTLQIFGATKNHCAKPVFEWACLEGFGHRSRSASDQKMQASAYSLVSLILHDPCNVHFSSSVLYAGTGGRQIWKTYLLYMSGAKTTTENTRYKGKVLQTHLVTRYIDQRNTKAWGCILLFKYYRRNPILNLELYSDCGEFL
jgi:hypothetical protein